MNKFNFRLLICMTTLLALCIAGIIMTETNSDEDISWYPHKVKETQINRLIERQKNLEDTVANLESKVRILNKYLNYKHLEYIDSCNLVEKKSK